MIIGLTGQTGAGKSTVSNILKENGFCIIDCDKVAREVTVNNKELLSNLAACFGKEIIYSDGSLNRKALANLAFSSKEKTELLNSVIHPVILEEIKSRINNNKCKYIILDAPTLFESGAACLCDKIISVIANEDIRLERILKRDNISENEAKLRISAQGNDEFYISRSDAVIINNCGENELISQIKSATAEIGAV